MTDDSPMGGVAAAAAAGSTSIAQLPLYNPLDPTRPKIWPDFTLLMPVCAVGNIGQLACDLIISTLASKQECQLVGRLYSPSLMPVVGPNAFTQTGPPTTSTEVYESKKHKLVIIQQRTSYFKQLKNLYIGELTNWIKQAQFDQLVVLTSSFAQCNPDTSQLGELYPQSCPVQSIATSLFQHGEKLRHLNVKQIPDKKTIKVVQDGLTFLPGSGLTKPLIRACERAFIPALFLVDFCSEGINIHDCYQVVNIVDLYLNLGCGASQTLDLSKLKVSQDSEPIRPLESGDGNNQDENDDCKTTICSWVEPYSWAQAQC